MGIEANERDRKTSSYLLLELFEDVLKGNDQNALTTVVANEFGNNHTDFKSLAQTYGVGKQNMQTNVFRAERFTDGVELIARRIGQHPYGNPEIVLIQRHRYLADCGLKPEAGTTEVQEIIWFDGDFCRIKNFEVAVEGYVKSCRSIAYMIWNTANFNFEAVTRLGDMGNQSILITSFSGNAKRKLIEGIRSIPA